MDLRKPWALAALFVPALAGAQEPVEPPTVRPTRVANVNLVTLGGGGAYFDHPNFPRGAFPAITYQRRILRREVRPVLVWARAAFQYLADDAKYRNAYTVWDETDDAPFPDEIVSERTRDISLRGEAIADVLHQPHWALYGGAGFVLHSLAFSSDGNISAIDIFKADVTDTSPSFLGGARLFSAARPYTGYFEVRYGRVFGKTDNTGPRPWLTRTTFAFSSVNALFVEAGLGLHW